MFDALKKDIELRQIRESQEDAMANLILETVEEDFMDNLIGLPVDEDQELEKVIEGLPENLDDEPPTESDITNAMDEEPDPSLDELVNDLTESFIDINCED